MPAPSNFQSLIALSIIPLICLILSGCQTNSTNCAGWKPIPLKPASAVYLAGNDEKAAGALVGHDRYGKAQGCWR